MHECMKAGCTYADVSLYEDTYLCEVLGGWVVGSGGWVGRVGGWVGGWVGWVGGWVGACVCVRA